MNPQSKNQPVNNSIFVIFPYHENGVWMFNDEARGILREPFLGNINSILSLLSSEIKNAQKGFALYFSDRFFPGVTARFIKIRDEFGGASYRSEQFNLEGYLCPCLHKFYPGIAPSQLFAVAKPKL